MSSLFSDISLLIIAGGQSSRMKQDKRLVEVDGVSLLERILIKASRQKFAKIFLCVEDFLPKIEEIAIKYDVEMVFDKFKNAGPMSGLAEGLSNITTDWAFAISCDMPFFEFDVVAPLMDNLKNVKVAMFSHQPLAAFYHKSMSKNFIEALKNNNRKLQFVISQVPNYIIDVKSKEKFFNVNTKSDLKLARGRAANINRKIPIVSIIAPQSSTGKTTFIEKMIPKLNELGIRIGIVKSDSHGFNLDIEGKDSWRFNQAGANSVAVISPNGWFINQKCQERAEILEIVNKMDDVDLILTESRSHDTIPAISIYRGLNEPLINENVAAIFTDRNLEINDIAQFDLNNIDQAIDICIFLSGRSV